MKHPALMLALLTMSIDLFASDNDQLQKQIKQLQQQTKVLQVQLIQLKKELQHKKNDRQQYTNINNHSPVVDRNKQLTNVPVRPTTSAPSITSPTAPIGFHSSPLLAHAIEGHSESVGFYPTALIADDNVITYIAGTPVVTAPYLGDRPAFDGSDYIVNISSINRDIRLMQQRRRLYRAYEQVGYPHPNVPIVALSGKAEADGTFNQPFHRQANNDLTLGSSEIDVAAALNDYVEGFIGVAFDASAPQNGGTRISNSSFDLNLGFVNIGNLNKTPFYFTAGQLYAPFGRYSSSMISAPLTMTLARVKTRPFILGYKSQTDTGIYAAVYVFSSETAIKDDNIAGFNLGYIFDWHKATGDMGVGIIGSITDSQGMQQTGSPAFTTFGGFSSLTNGNEHIKKIPGWDVHGNVSYDRYSLTAEWVGTTEPFQKQDLSFDGHDARPQAAQIEAGVTFKVFDKPASFAMGYQWSKETLALNLPNHRLNGVFNISIWKDTVESIEYRHDIDFKTNHFANGASQPDFINVDTLGTRKSVDSVVAQVGIYF